jgi:histone H3/H4
LKDAAELISLKTKAAFGDTCSMEITDDGKLVISAESKSSDRLVKALASAGVAVPDSVSDGVVLADTRRSFSPALMEELKQTSQTKVDTELKKGLSDVLGALATAIQKRKEGDFATVDDVKTVQYTDVVAAVKELCDKGYLTPVVEGWAYTLTDAGRQSVQRFEMASIIEQDEAEEFVAAFDELMSKYDEYLAKWTDKFGSDEGFDEWFTGQVPGFKDESRRLESLLQALRSE